MSATELNALSEMFPTVELQLIREVLNESGSLEPSINRLLELTDPQHRRETFSITRSVPVNSPPSTSGGHERQMQDPSTADDEQMAYALALHLAEESAAEREFDESQAKNKRRNPIKVKTSNDELNKLQKKLLNLNETTAKKVKLLYHKMTGRGVDYKKHKKVLTDNVDNDYLMQNSPSPTDDLRRPSFTYDEKGNMILKQRETAVSSSSGSSGYQSHDQNDGRYSLRSSSSANASSRRQSQQQQHNHQSESPRQHPYQTRRQSNLSQSPTANQQSPTKSHNGNNNNDSLIQF